MTSYYHSNLTFTSGPLPTYFFRSIFVALPKKPMVVESVSQLTRSSCYNKELESGASWKLQRSSLDFERPVGHKKAIICSGQSERYIQTKQDVNLCYTEVILVKGA